MPHRGPALLLAIALVALTACGKGDSQVRPEPDGAVGPGPQKAPNIVVVMTDDQATDTMQAMTQTQRIIGDKGTTFEASVTSFPLCCPSRATFLTGQYAHNHGVLDNHPPEGGLGRLDQKATMPVWLSEAGYRTAFVGKYLNGYGHDDLGGPTYVPPGWDDWFGLTAQTKKAAFSYDANRNGKIESFGEEERSYKTDELATAATQIIRDNADREKPLFLWVATSAPHLDPVLEGAKRNPAPAPRDKNAFPGAMPDPGPAFDERDVSDKPKFVQGLPRLDKESRDFIDLTYRSQLESLLAVDDLVAKVADTLKKEGELQNTLLIFTSDNGFLRGQHRLDSGKAKVYEEAIGVPLLVRGRGFEPGSSTSNPVANVDLAPTIMRAAGVKPPHPLDGIPLEEALKPGGRDRDILLEVNSRKADQFEGLRTKRWAYAERENGVDELYDLRSDPFELENLNSDPRYDTVRRELSGTLARLRNCSGRACR